ncbi:MAG: hypothetical protein Q9160_007372 [Pyrenula sp. 1 TL-2023]
MTGSYYDSDDALNASPRLQPIKPNFRSEETPPPFIHEKSSSSSPATERGDNDELLSETARPASGGPRKQSKKRRKKSRVRPSQGDTVLISYLAPNRPDIAQQAGKESLGYISEGASESSIPDADSDVEDMPSANPESQEDATKTAQATLQYMDNNDVPDQPSSTKIEREPDSQRQGISADNADFSGDRKDAAKKPFCVDILSAISPPSRQVTIHNVDERPAPKNRDEDTIATSPNLAKFAIKEADAPDGDKLPALQNSPPRTTSAHTGDHTQSLPSLQTALGNLTEQEAINSASPAYPSMSAQSPTRVTRPPYIPQHPGPSPSSYSQSSPASSKDTYHMSPPSFPSQPSQPSHPIYWRQPSKIEPPPYSTPSSGDAATPSTATLKGESPSRSYPTPNDQDHRMNPDGESVQLVNGAYAPDGPLITTAFKCTHPGCTAPPFQTQYLLNSHANVHSDTRPHYCSVKGCPRSYGGKGFKRKNEMIRHGLVHESPGYVCPFCPDQQHKYPRPDNLQR